MRTLLGLALVAIASILLTGCPLAPTCGGFEGGGNQAFERGGDSLLLCENSGFIATVNGNVIEGRHMVDAAGQTFGVRGDTGELAFDLVLNGDGTATTPQLGETAWTAASLDEVALDHSNVLCTDLETRAWWTAR